MITADITNMQYTGDEELIIHEFSGAIEDLPDHVTEHLTLSDAHRLDAGDWITIIDGEVIEIDQLHPYHIQVERQSLADQLCEAWQSYTMNEHDRQTLMDAAEIMDDLE